MSIATQTPPVVRPRPKPSPRLRRSIYLLHLWAGLGSGLIVFIVSLTACLLAFEDQIKDLAPHRHVAAEARPMLPPSALIPAAKSALPAGKPITGISYGAPDRPVVVASSNRKKGENFAVYLNPYTGQTLARENLSQDPFITIMRLHRWLLLPTEIGRPIVGAATLIFVFMLISGLVLWWPRSKAQRRNALRVRWSTPGRRRLYDLHNVLGFYALGVSLVLAISGLTWSYGWVSDGLAGIAQGGPVPEFEPPKSSPASSSSPANGEAGSPLDAIYADAAAQAKTLGMARLSLSLPRDPEAAISANLNPAEHLHGFGRVSRYYDQHTGSLLSQRTPADLGPGQTVQNLYHDVHFGTIGGLPTQILAFGASAVSASLPVTGLLLWLGRRRRPAEVQPDEASELLAST